MKKLLIFLFLFSSTYLIADSNFAEAQKLLMNNKLPEAALLLKKSIVEEENNAEVYIYLGYIYEVEKDYKTAITYLKKGIDKTSGEDYKIYYNLGNNYFKDKDYDNAILMYTKSIELENDFAEAYLNRANCNIKKEELLLALDDYKIYESLKPNDPKTKKIANVMQVIYKMIEEKETREKEEKERREAEEARKKTLLDSVLNSLDDASEDLTNLSATTETVKDADFNVDIED